MNKITKLKSILILLIGVIIFSCNNKKENKYIQFWTWFEHHQKNYYQDRINEKFYTELSKELTKVDPNLCFEFGPIKKNGKKEFIISADGIVKSFQKVEKLVKCAPKLKVWKVIAFRQRMPLDYQSVKIDNLKLSYKDIYFRYAEDGDKIGIELNIRNFDDSNNMNKAIFLLLDALLGEYDVETKISWIERKQLNEEEKEVLISFIELRSIVDQLEMKNK